ncbi:F-box protein CPR1-like [Vicia villosa]|uniref:F-box protein CPR1-like n=1 Tax=Vicia villosa TaxID=3911 RepID=UPI00273B0CC3|nr:F-box protein CPR1-like [Vicia villosa]
MDLSFSSSNVRVNNHIPDDIVFSILSKLSLSGERFQNKVRFHWDKLPLRDRRNNFSFDILSPISFNGTLFLKYYNFYGTHKFMLWNPTTMEFKIFSAKSDCFSKVWSDHYQVGYDHVKDDYKMIRLTHCRSRSIHGISSFWEIFSLNNNYWRKIDDHFPLACICHEAVYLDGVSHWLERTETHIRLVSFDFCKESFITTSMPSDTDGVFDFNSTREIILTVLNRSIAFILNYEETSTLHISILGELGVKESWTKLFIVGPLTCLNFLIGVGKKGNILITKKDNELAWFDISTETIDEIGITAKSYCKISIHKESLLPIGGIYREFSSCFQPHDI